MLGEHLNSISIWLIDWLIIVKCYVNCISAIFMTAPDGLSEKINRTFVSSLWCTIPPKWCHFVLWGWGYHAIHNPHLSLEGDEDEYFVHEECHATCMQFKTIYSSSSFWAVVDGPLQGKIVRSHIHLNIAHQLNTARNKTLSYKISCLQTCFNRECYWDTAHVTLINNQSICKTSMGML